jgi:uncharacterized protein (PEP-CTERM system associated)
LAQRCRASAAVAAILAFAAAPAAAVDWEANHFVSTRLALTNSDGLSSSNDDGFGTSLRGTIGSNLRGTGRRLNFAADTTLSLITRSSDGTPEIDQNIRALSTLELWKNRVLVDANLTSTRELVSSNSQVSGADAGTDNDERVSVTSASISPYWQQRYGQWAQSLVRYRHTEVISGGSNANDSRNDSLELQLVAGRKFQPWRPALLADWVRIDERSNASLTENDLTRFSITFANEVALSRRYSLTASIGYDNVDASSQTRDLSGVSWSVGANGQPGPRSSFQFSVGQRFGDLAINGNASYALTANLTLRLGASHSLASGLQQLVNDSNLVTVDPITGELVTPEGLPAGFAGSGLDNQLSLRQSVSATLVGDYGRNRIVLSGFAEQRQFDVGDEDIARVRGLITRRLSPKLSASVSSFYRYTRPQVTEATHTVNARFDLNYRLGSRTTLFGGYSYTDRRSTDASLEYNEHVASVGGRISF